MLTFIFFNKYNARIFIYIMNMIKVEKITTIIILMLFLFSSFSINSQAKDFEGLYLGGNLTTRAKADAYSGNIESLHINSDTGIGIEALFGFGWRFTNIYLGVEMQNSISTTKLKIYDSGLSTKSINEYSGKNIRFGYIFDNTALMYTILGTQKIQINSDDSTSSFRNLHTSEAFKYGIGGEFKLLENINARLEYTQSKFNGIHFITSDSSLFSDLTLKIIKLGIVYNF